VIAEGKRVKLRWMEFDDIPFLITVRNKSRYFLHDVRKFGLQDTVEWWQRAEREYVIIELPDDTPVGYLRTSNWEISPGAARHVMIGADVHPDHHRRGYAFEAYTLFLHYLFKIRDLNKVSLEVLSNNEGAIALYKRLGFVVEGTKREEILRGGKYLDSIIMSMLRSEFKKNA